MARTYILDTNVLLFDPNCLYRFDEHDLVIPIVVIEEIDRFKRNMDDTGRNARQVSRELDKLRESGSLRGGVKLPTGGTLRVMFSQDVKEPGPMTESSVDNEILNIAAWLTEQNGREIILVSRDTNMRIKGDAAGVKSEDYKHGKVEVSLDDQYLGYREHVVESQVIDALYADGRLALDDDLGCPNECLILTDGGKKSCLARINEHGDEIRHISSKPRCIWGITPRNKEQRFALELLLDPDIMLVTLSGAAGTGKTLLALAAGLMQVCDEQTFRKLLVARPVFPMGRDIGYLPGDVDEKLRPWMQPIYDNLELLVGSQEGKPDAPYKYLFDKGLVQVEPLTYIRGRSIPNQFMIVDEAQNLTPHEVKTILTRAGHGTKIVLTGDPNQIDNPYVDSSSNGLSYVIDRFKQDPLAGHITLVKGERSRLAEAAARIL